MQYCSLQHWTLLLSPVPSTTVCCFCFGSIPLFFLELFLHSSPVGYWALTDLGSSFSILWFCLSIPFMAFSRQEYWSGLPFFYPVDVGNLISGSSAFSKSSLIIWKFMVHVLLKPGLENFEHYFASMWDECNCAVVWAFFGIAFLWDWNENWPFPVLWPLLSFPNLLAYWVQHFHSIII